MGGGGRKEEVLTLTLPGHKVNLDLCKRRKSKWHGAGGKGRAQQQGPHPGRGASSPMKWSLADRLQAKPSGTKL